MLFESLDKLRTNSILSAILLAALGVVILICPESHIPILALVFGYLMIILALIMLLNFMSAKKSLMAYIKFVGALILLIGGIYVLVYQSHLSIVLAVLFGVLLILDGGRTVFHSLTYSRRSHRKGWWILMILSFMMIAAGIVVLCNRWWDTPVKLAKVIGCAVLFSAFVSGLRLIWTWPLKRSKGDEENVEG